MNIDPAVSDIREGNAGLRKKISEEYWIKKLSNFKGVRNKRLQVNSSLPVAHASVTLSADDVRSLELIAKGNRLGRFTLFLAVYIALLRKYFSEKQVMIASCTDKSMVFFDLETDCGLSLKELVFNTRVEVLETEKYNAFTVEEWTSLLRDKGIQDDGLFHFSFQYSESEGDFPVVPLYGKQLGLNVKGTGNGFVLTLHYGNDFLPNGAAAYFLNHYRLIIASLKEYAGVPLKNIGFPIWDQVSMKEVVQTQTIASGINIVRLFENCVQRFPEKPALTFGERTFNYKTLNEITNQLARFFINSFDLKKESRVGILVGKSELPVIALLAVLKAGAVFIPIDPENPAPRKQHIINNSDLDLLVIDSALFLSLEGYTGNIFAVDIQTDYLALDNSNLSSGLSGSDLAYMMYTSGTTGIPKAVMIEHHSVVNYVSWLKNDFGLSENESSLLLSSYAFDLGYTCIFGTLLTGGHLHVSSIDPVKSPGEVLDYISTKRISYIKLTPSLFYILTHNHHFSLVSSSLSLRRIFLGGEPIRIADLKLYLQHNEKVTFINHYGPTETTIGTAAFILNNQKIGEYTGFNMIGKATQNNEILVLNDDLELVPDGFFGEICIGGEGVARGYYNNNEATAGKFISHPDRQGMRIYRSGDYGRKMPDGNIILSGRKDNQYKIRGYRVELAEIEQALLCHHQIEEAKVLVREKENVWILNAYIKCKDTPALATSALREFLLARLPEYMIPSGFNFLDLFPLTPNGKIDTHALSCISQQRPDTAVSYTLPANNTEQILFDIWCKALDRSDIGTGENFFDAGGNSLLIVQVNAEINKFYPQVTIGDLFAYTNITSLADYIIRLNGTGVMEVPDSYTTFPLTFFREFDGYMPGDRENYDYSFTIGEDTCRRLNEIAAMNKVRVGDLLVALFFCTLQEMTDEDLIAVHVCKAPDYMVKRLRIAMNDFENVASLYRRITGDLTDDLGDIRNAEGVYALNNIDLLRFSGKQKQSLLPFVCLGELPAGALSSAEFDVSLGISSGDINRFDFSFRYNGQKLRQVQMEKFIQCYIDFIASL